jgi:hypothetical protein
MAASATNYDQTRILVNNGALWLDVAVPASGSRLTLDTATGTPEAVANPNAKHIGLTEAGSTMSLKTQVQAFEADELTTPWKQQLTSEEALIKGTLLQVEDWTILGLITPGGTKSVGTGFEQLTFGGKTVVETKSVAVIGPSAKNAGHWVVFLIYSGFNQAGIEFAFARKDFSKCPYEFVGQSIASRPAGDQAGLFYHTIP